MRQATLVLAVLALAPFHTVAAHGGWAHCNPLVEIQLGDGNPPTIYIVIDDPLVHGVSVWVYEETNGIQYLQRGDPICDEAGEAGVEPDTIIL